MWPMGLTTDDRVGLLKYSFVYVQEYLCTLQVVYQCHAHWVTRLFLNQLRISSDHWDCWKLVIVEVRCRCVMVRVRSALLFKNHRQIWNNAPLSSLSWAVVWKDAESVKHTKPCKCVRFGLDTKCLQRFGPIPSNDIPYKNRTRH